MKSASSYTVLLASDEVQTEHIASIRPEIERIQRGLDAMGELEGEPYFMREAVREACLAALSGSYGVGAVLVHPEHGLVARGHNRISEKTEPMRHVLHAEMDTLRHFHVNHAHGHLPPLETTMYSTLEPCPMCTIGMWNEGVREVIVGSLDEDTGWLLSNKDYVPPSWVRLLDKSGTHHRLGQLPEDLRALSEEVFLVTKHRLDHLLASN